MQIPLQVTFRDMAHSDAMEVNIRERAAKLERYHDHVISCRVVVETQTRRHNKGNLYHVRVDVTVPDAELVASREPPKHQAHEDPYVAIRDAFDATARQLKAYVNRRKQHVKTHQAPAHGRVALLSPEGNYGRIQTPDGRDVYFHRNSVLNGDFDKLSAGAEVRFDEEQGDDGPQASTVKLIGKHHIAE